jgi:outer membrane protein assembly factor BamB
MLLSITLSAQQGSPAGEKYRLKKIIPVEGRQGIASDENYYYVSSSVALYKYDKTGKLLKKTDNAFKGFQKEVNHFGDIDVYNGELFTGVEWFVDGVGKNIQVAVYDANTLEYKYSIDFDPESGQTEVSGITIDRERNMVWMTDWVNGTHIYRYDLTTKKYSGKVHLQPGPQYQQGIFYKDGKVYISSDDGDADFFEPDNIYVANVSDLGKTYAPVTNFKVCKEFIRAGEIEGLSIDPVTGDLLVLSNRGSRIVLGMVKGFYDGYTTELHELYVYEKIKN